MSDNLVCQNENEASSFHFEDTKKKNLFGLAPSFGVAMSACLVGRVTGLGDFSQLRRILAISTIFRLFDDFLPFRLV
jgi:hypothetical protein